MLDLFTFSQGLKYKFEGLIQDVKLIQQQKQVLRKRKTLMPTDHRVNVNPIN